MNDWLIGFSEHRKTDDEIFQEYVDGLSPSELQKLAHDVDPTSLPTQVELMGLKIADAVRHGQELAHEQDDLLEKVAFLPALAAGAARLAGGGALKSIAGGVAKDMAISAAGNKIMGALKPAAPAASAAGEVAGGFKYAGVLNSLGSNAGGLLQRAAAYTVKNPGTALTAAGAVGGALMAPRDPQTGQKQYLRGAVMGGGAAAGINALSNGAIANKMRSSVMNRNNPILGDRVRQYAMDASAAAKGKTRSGVTVNGAAQYGKAPAPAAAPQAAAQAAPAAAAAPAAEAAPYMGGPTMRGPVSGSAHTSGPMMGAVKVASMASMSPAQQILYVAHLDALEKRANRQTLTYDPATKTFTRHHMNMDFGSKDLVEMGAKPIPAGATEPVKNSMTHAGPDLAPFGSQDYIKTRLERVRARNGINPDVGAPLGTKVAPSTPIAPAQNTQVAARSMAPAAAAPYGSREYFQQRLQQAGVGRAAAVPPPIPTRIPGAAAGVAGVGAAAAKPATGFGATIGKLLTRR